MRDDEREAERRQYRRLLGDGHLDGPTEAHGREAVTADHDAGRWAPGLDRKGKARRSRDGQGQPRRVAPGCSSMNRWRAVNERQG
jgi:hypothetical protein